MLKSNLVEAVTKLIKSKVITEAHGKSLVSLPLVEIDTSDEGERSPWGQFVNRYDEDFVYRYIDSAEFVLLEAVYEFKDQTFCAFKVSDVDETTRFYRLHFEYFSHSAAAQKEGRIEYKFLFAGDLLVDPRENKFTFTGLTRYLPSRKTTETDRMSHDINVAMIGLVENLLRGLKMFTDFQESMDLYPVDVRPVNPVKRSPIDRVDKRLEFSASNAPRLIYLNRLPVETDESESAVRKSSHTQKVHQRPGHWRTLTHERWRNHEKFGIHKGVRVKPYWVGNRETNYNGNVYRLIVRETINES